MNRTRGAKKTTGAVPVNHLCPIGLSLLWLLWEFRYYHCSGKGFYGRPTPYMDPFFLLLGDLAFLGLSIVLLCLHWRKNKRLHWGFPVSACLLVSALFVAWRFMAEVGSVT